MPKPLVMGVLNVTPDSFSDGGRWLDAGAAVMVKSSDRPSADHAGMGTYDSPSSGNSSDAVPVRASTANMPRVPFASCANTSRRRPSRDQRGLPIRLRPGSEEALQPAAHAVRREVERGRPDVPGMRVFTGRFAIDGSPAARVQAGELLGKAAHDLREPLNTVQQFSSLLYEDHGQTLPADGQAFMQELSAALQKQGY